MACGLLVVIQSWLSAQISGFGTTVAIGAVGLIFGYMLISISEGTLSRWYPWTLPISTSPAGSQYSTLIPALFGFLGGLLLGVLACLDLDRCRNRA